MLLEEVVSQILSGDWKGWFRTELNEGQKRKHGNVRGHQVEESAREDSEVRPQASQVLLLL